MIFACLFILFGCLQTFEAAPKLVDDGQLELIILHNNDMHARFEQTSINGNKCAQKDVEADKCYGGFARVAHEVREYRKRETEGGTSVLYLNAGDTYTGTPWFQLYKENITSTFLNVLKPDAIVRIQYLLPIFNFD
jgi:2',3'-cyclic-nucleotide 2'-phosphodiesterase (5'-nucleotidase family)